MITDLENLALKTNYNDQKKLMVGNGKCLSITHISSTFLLFGCSSRPLKHTYENHVYVDFHIRKSLVSISKLTYENHVYVEFHSNFCLVNDKTLREVLLHGKLKDGLYLLRKPKAKTTLHSESCSTPSLDYNTILFSNKANEFHCKPVKPTCFSVYCCLNSSIRG